MEQAFDDKHRRRILIASAFITLVALFCIRFFVVPAIQHEPPLPPFTVVDSVLDNLMVAIIASIAIASLSSWIQPRTSKISHVEIVEPYNISTTLKHAFGNTEEWLCKVHTGRYFRSVVLPALAHDARQDNSARRIVLLLLDPDNRVACEHYAHYRQGLRSASLGQPWTPDRVRIEVYATILSAYARKAESPLLEISVGLFQIISVFRLELSSSLALITKEDRAEPALKCDFGTFFYKSYREDFRLSNEQARHLPHTVRGVGLSDVSVSSAKSLFQALDMDMNFLTDETLQMVVKIAREGVDPYA